MFLANTFEDDFVKGYCISTYIRTMIRTPRVQFLFALEAALSLLFVFVFHYIRVLENRKIPRGLSTVGIDQVAELNEIRTHKITFLFGIMFYIKKAHIFLHMPFLVLSMVQEQNYYTLPK